jgi:Site-specific recombinase XerD
MAKIPKYYVRSDGLHESILRVNGKRKAFRGKTDTEVYNKIKAYNQSEDAKPKGILFKEAADAWWKECEPRIAYNTVQSYRPAVDRAKEHFGDYAIDEITAKDIDLYIRKFAETRYQRTVQTQLQIIRQVLEYAELECGLQFNPARAVKIPRGLKKSHRPAPPKEQIEKIKQSANLPFGLFAFLIYETGCRRGEALALKYEDIDRKNKTVSIAKSVYYKSIFPQIKEPKTERGRRNVPLLDGLRSTLPKKKAGYIFSNDNGRAPLTRSDMLSAWKKYQAESGVTVTPHQIRHGYATALFEAGVDIKTAQVLLGHAQISTTMDIYTDVRSNVIKEAAKKMNKSF